MDVFTVHHIHLTEYEENARFIGIDSSQQQAESAIQRIQQQPGFCNTLHDFTIDRYTLDEDNWTEGFFAEYHRLTVEENVEELFEEITTDLTIGANSRYRSFITALFQAPSGIWSDMRIHTAHLPHVLNELQHLAHLATELQPNWTDETIYVLWSPYPDNPEFVIISYYFAPTMLFKNVIYNKSLFDRQNTHEPIQF